MGPEFAYGEWQGFWVQPDGPDRHPMKMTLKFEGGKIDGVGDDEVGMFIVDGVYDEKSKLCSWTKKYVAMHEVLYSGSIDGRSIRGTWTVPKAWSGPFQLTLGKRPWASNFLRDPGAGTGWSRAVRPGTK
jgi:hypothetical protein